jgi:hypothetical protein
VIGKVLQGRTKNVCLLGESLGERLTERLGERCWMGGLI